MIGDHTYPIAKDTIIWETTRSGSPGKLTFTCIKDNALSFAEGEPVRLSVDGANLFYGFVFSKTRDKNEHIEVTAYDQLSYFKNKDTYVYEDKTASEVIKMLAADFQLQTGNIADTGYKIEYRIEKDKTLFDIVQNALDLTLQARGNMYVLYDEFGKLSLKNIEDMRLEILIDEQAAQDYRYQTSIDTDTFNRIKLSYENDKTGKREIYIAQDSGQMNRWGILQYYETVSNDNGLQEKANGLLSLYNHLGRSLSVTGIFGDVRARAGSGIVVSMTLGDITSDGYMIAEKVKHHFSSDGHFMDITLAGGVLSG